jgi:hypothetical protein
LQSGGACANMLVHQTGQDFRGVADFVARLAENIVNELIDQESKRGEVICV